MLPRAALEPCMTDDSPKNHWWRAEHSWTSDPERLKPGPRISFRPRSHKKARSWREHLLAGRKLYSQLIRPNDSGVKVECNLTGSGQIFTVVKASHEIEPNRLNFSARNQCGAIHRLCFRGQNMLSLGGNELRQGDRNLKTLCALHFLETERG